MTGMTMSDLGRVQWLPTLKLALARSVASAAVLTVVMALFGGQQGAGALFGFFLYWAVASAIAVPLTSLAIKAVCAMMAAMGLGIGVLAGNIMLFFLALAVASGDPIVWLVNRRFP